MHIDSRAVHAYLTRWESLLALATILFLVFASVITPGLLSEISLTNAFQVMAEKSLLVLPLMMLIIAREIDRRQGHLHVTQ